MGKARLRNALLWVAHRLPTELSSVQELRDGALQSSIELLERWVSDAVTYVCRLMLGQ